MNTEITESLTVCTRYHVMEGHTFELIEPTLNAIIFCLDFAQDIFHKCKPLRLSE